MLYELFEDIACMEREGFSLKGLWSGKYQCYLLELFGELKQILFIVRINNKCIYVHVRILHFIL